MTFRCIRCGQAFSTFEDNLHHACPGSCREVVLLVGVAVALAIITWVGFQLAGVVP